MIRRHYFRIDLKLINQNKMAIFKLFDSQNLKIELRKKRRKIKRRGNIRNQAHIGKE